MDKSLILKIIEIGLRLEISNTFTVYDDKILIELTDGSKAVIETEYAN